MWRCCGRVTASFSAVLLHYLRVHPYAFVQPLVHQGVALEEVALDLIATVAVELAPLPSLDFYSRLFVVWKTSGSWRPVIDLSTLNHFKKTVWLKSRGNWDALAAECDAIVTAILRSENSMRALSHVLLEACNRHIPRKTILLRTNNQPWFEESCRRAHHCKQTLFHVWRHNRSQLNYLNFLEARRDANRIFHEAEKRYNQKLKTQLQEVTQDHLWWTKLKSSIFGSSTLIPLLLSGDGKLLVDSNDKAELLDETFSAKQSNEDVVIPSGCHPEPHLTKFAFRSRDVKKILDGLDSWGGEDPDGFIPLIFKKMSSVLSPKLSRVYRHLFKNSLFLDKRKIGNIAPVPKGALSADSNNYRPIIILPVMFKVAEKLIFKPLYKYLEANAYLPSSQYAYRKKLGTCDALLDISSLVQENLDKGF